MGPKQYNCIICGWYFHGSELWLQEFRIVHSDSEATHLSGVGSSKYDDYSNVPLDPGKNWREVERHEETFESFDLDHLFDWNHLPVMTDSYEKSGHGYLMHDSCWRLLQKAVSPQCVPLDRLYQVCASVRFAPGRLYGGLSWDHGYNGIASVDYKTNYPWEQYFKVYPEILDQAYVDSTEQVSHDFCVDPFHVPSALPFLRACTSDPPPGPIYWTRDCFAPFPLEILEMIAISLSTKDAFSLRLASRSFLPLFSSHRFWASRFNPMADRGFLAEALDNCDAIDLRYIWRATGDSCPSGIRNSRRVWSLIQCLAPLLYLRVCTAQHNLADALQSPDNISITAAADLQPKLLINGYIRFPYGCAAQIYQRVSVPSQLCCIAVSVVFCGALSFISGLRFISDDDVDVCVGYINADDEIMWQTSKITGFFLAMGPKGLQAIRVANAGILSPWCGDNTNVPITERLDGFESLEYLEAGSDGFKLVSIALSGSLPQQNKRTLGQVRALRKNAYWYPNVPPSSLNLNEQLYDGEGPSSSRYLPLIWNHFGGPKGSYLRHLTCVLVSRTGSYLSAIDFKYDTEDTTMKGQKLGSGEISETSMAMNFPIDGPNGEYITSIDVSIPKKAWPMDLNYTGNGKLESLKLTTSWNRSYHFLPRDLPAHETVLTKLEVGAGTTITGFYAAQWSHHGLIHLGVISETTTDAEISQRLEGLGSTMGGAKAG